MGLGYPIRVLKVIEFTIPLPPFLKEVETTHAPFL